MRIGFARSTSLSPGFGQPVTVSGVKVGIVDDVDPRAGHGGRDGADRPRPPAARLRRRGAALVPATPSKDMQVELDPGTPRAGDLGRRVVPIARTDVPIDADELMAALDTDTRDYLATLLSAAGIGLHERGADLRALVRNLRPTLRQVRAINTQLAGRQRDVAELVHNLSRLSRDVAVQAPALRSLVRDSSRTLGATARNDRALGDGLALLPPTLTATRATLASTRALAGALGPALTALTPATRKTPARARADPAARGCVDPARPRPPAPARGASRPLAKPAAPEHPPAHRDDPGPHARVRVAALLHQRARPRRRLAARLPVLDGMGGHNIASAFSTRDADRRRWIAG